MLNIFSAQPPAYREWAHEEQSPHFPRVGQNSSEGIPMIHTERTHLLGSERSYGTVHILAAQAEKRGFSLKHGILLVVVGIITGYLLCDPLNRTRHELSRRQWQDEVDRQARLRSDMSIERQIFQAEQVSWKIERDRRALEEWRRMEEERRQSENIAWANLTASSHCLTYGEREYTATLINVPLGFHAIDECHNRSVEIHDKKWFPTRCEDEVRIPPNDSELRTYLKLNSHCVGGLRSAHWPLDRKY